MGGFFAFQTLNSMSISTNMQPHKGVFDRVPCVVGLSWWVAFFVLASSARKIQPTTPPLLINRCIDKKSNFVTPIFRRTNYKELHIYGYARM